MGLKLESPNFRVEHQLLLVDKILTDLLCMQRVMYIDNIISNNNNS